MQPETLQTVTLVLAMTVAIGPILFGYIVWKMFQLFPTRKEFDEYRDRAELERQENREQLLSMEKQIIGVMVKQGEKDT